MLFPTCLSTMGRTLTALWTVWFISCPWIDWSFEQLQANRIMLFGHIFCWRHLRTVLFWAWGRIVFCCWSSNIWLSMKWFSIKMSGCVVFQPLDFTVLKKQVWYSHVRIATLVLFIKCITWNCRVHSSSLIRGSGLCLCCGQDSFVTLLNSWSRQIKIVNAKKSILLTIICPHHCTNAFGGLPRVHF